MHHFPPPARRAQVAFGARCAGFAGRDCAPDGTAAEAHFYSIVGTGERSGGAGRVAIPLSQVRRVEAWRTDGGRTALLTVGILAGVLGLVVLAAANVPPSYGEF